MKKTLLLVTISIFTLQATAQDGAGAKEKAAAAKVTTKEFKDGWTRGGFFGANGSNVLFDNWAAGGSNQSGLVLNASLYAIKKKKNWPLGKLSGCGLWSCKEW